MEGKASYSIGLAAGLDVETPIGNVGVEANAFSVEIAGTRDDIGNGVIDETSYLGQDNWMKITQGAGINLLLGGASIEREMLSPTGGGAFYDKKVTRESNILGYFREEEYYQDGLYTKAVKPAPANTEGFKLGFGVKFLLGAKWELKIKRKR